jgi:hypothetical protein
MNISNMEEATAMADGGCRVILGSIHRYFLQVVS